MTKVVEGKSGCCNPTARFQSRSAESDHGYTSATAARADYHPMSNKRKQAGSPFDFLTLPPLGDEDPQGGFVEYIPVDDFLDTVRRPEVLYSRHSLPVPQSDSAITLS